MHAAEPAALRPVAAPGKQEFTLGHYYNPPNSLPTDWGVAPACPETFRLWPAPSVATTRPARKDSRDQLTSAPTSMTVEDDPELTSVGSRHLPGYTHPMLPDMSFIQLNRGWNAEPNAPEPRTERHGRDMLLFFLLNAFAFKQFSEDDRGIVRFVRCARYRLGGTNDEGWYRGQCRYSDLAPRWGEFYEIVGIDPLRDQPNDWVAIGDSGRARHFLFYFRDTTFECIADDWRFEAAPANALFHSFGASPSAQVT
jgi:hypothetical protein